MRRATRRCAVGTVAATLAWVAAQPATAGAVLDRGQVVHINDDLRFEDRRIVDQTAAPIPDETDPVVVVERYADRIANGSEFMVMDFVLRASGEVSVRTFKVEEVAKSVSIITDDVAVVADPSISPVAPQRAEDSETRLCVTHTRVSHSAAKEQCYRQVNLAGLAADLICLLVIDLPFIKDGCDIAQDAVERKRKICEDLPDETVIWETCTTVPDDDTGIYPVDEPKNEAKAQAKETYCNYRQPCEMG